jgi:flagellar biosynthesis protein FlhF
VLVDLPALARGEELDQLLDRIGFHVLADADPSSGYGVVHLVLSPLFASGQISAFIRSYASERLAGIVWTKLDEAFSFGSMINTGESTGLPAVALSYGSGLRDTLAPAKHAPFWRLVFKHRLPGAGAAEPHAAGRGAATNARSNRSARPS